MVGVEGDKTRSISTSRSAASCSAAAPMGTVPDSARIHLWVVAPMFFSERYRIDEYGTKCYWWSYQLFYHFWCLRTPFVERNAPCFKVRPKRYCRQATMWALLVLRVKKLRVSFTKAPMDLPTQQSATTNQRIKRAAVVPLRLLRFKIEWQSNYYGYVCRLQHHKLISTLNTQNYQNPNLQAVMYLIAKISQISRS